MSDTDFIAWFIVSFAFACAAIMWLCLALYGVLKIIYMFRGPVAIHHVGSHEYCA